MKSKNQSVRAWSAGVDEAGRGPIAGPVAVGLVVVPDDFDWNSIPGVGDSKQVTEKNREAIFLRAEELQRDGYISFSVALVAAQDIDAYGIVASVKEGISRVFEACVLDPDTVSVKLDGLLSAPDRYMHQVTIVRGDASEKIIGLASILAKVTRDRYMYRLAQTYPTYGFEQHKGYGTRAHYYQIGIHGFCPEHRRSFLKKHTDASRHT